MLRCLGIFQVPFKDPLEYSSIFSPFPNMEMLKVAYVRQEEKRKSVHWDECIEAEESRVRED